MLALVVITAAGISNAQVTVHVGATTAFTATFVPDKGISESPRYKSRATYNWSPFGFNTGVDFGKKFGLSIESILSDQGQSFEVIDIADNVVGKRSIEMQYVHFPLLMKFMNEGNSAVRGNFNLGPQFSVLLKGTEEIEYSASTQTFVKGVTLPSGATAVKQRPDGNVQATVPTQPLKELASKNSGSFKNSEFQVVAAFGLDIDLTRHLYLSIQIRGNYSLTDSRNSKLISEIKSGSTSDPYGQRRNLLVGMQSGIHYVFDSTRSFKYKGSRRR